MTRLELGVLGSIVLAAGVASADPKPVTAANVLYLNRCVGGCTVTQGTSDAKAHTSPIPAAPGDSHLTEWAWGDAQWDAVVQCVREVYSPFDVDVVTDRPSDNVVYNEQMVAGLGDQLGHPEYGGVSPGVGCNPQHNTITFTFANGWGAGGGGPLAQVYTICGVIAQESGHAYGLDHAYQFAGGRSACTDPMTYRNDCGGQQFFRNDLAECGTSTPQACACVNPQNSHLILSTVLGVGTPITTPPTLTISSPAPNSTISKGQPVIAIAGAQRGVRRVELKLNGYKWNEVQGVEFGPTGQPTASYPLAIPNEVPDGVIDIEVTAKDDINAATTAPILRVTKGVACVTADTCLKGQRCDGEGRCLWDPATGAIGDPCEYPQFCTSGLCTGVSGEPPICTTACVLTASDSCPMGFECISTAPGQGVCLTAAAAAGGGCCSIGSDGAAQSALLAIGFAALLRRRRTRTN